MQAVGQNGSTQTEPAQIAPLPHKRKDHAHADRAPNIHREKYKTHKRHNNPRKASDGTTPSTSFFPLLRSAKNRERGFFFFSSSGLAACVGRPQTLFDTHLLHLTCSNCLPTSFPQSAVSTIRSLLASNRLHPSATFCSPTIRSSLSTQPTMANRAHITWAMALAAPAR